MMMDLLTLIVPLKLETALICHQSGLEVTLHIRSGIAKQKDHDRCPGPFVANHSWICHDSRTIFKQSS